MHRLTLFTASVVAAAAMLIGCEDPAAQARAEAQQVLEQAASELASAASMGAHPADEDFETAQQKLNAIVGKLGRVSADAEPGQRAAGGLIKAAALRAIADRQLRVAAEISDRHRLQRSVLAGRIDAANQLSAFADGRASIDFSQYQDQLAADREVASTQIQTFTQAQAELDAPISELVDANNAALEQVRQLRQESNDLFGKARELGNVEGFEYFEQAMAKQRQADQLQYQVGQREISLAFDLEPRQQLASTYDRYTNELIDAFDQSSQAISAFGETLHQSAAEIDQTADEMWQSIATDISTLSESMSTELQEAYTSAISNLEQAASAADQAGRQTDREGKMSAAMVAARAYEALGHANRRLARDLADQRLLVEQVVQSSAGAAIPGSMQDELDRLTTEHATAIAAANEAYSNADNLLNQAGTGDAVQLYKNAIAGATGSLSQPTPSAAPSPMESDEAVDEPVEGETPASETAVEGEPAESESDAAGENAAVDDGEQPAPDVDE